MPTKKKAFFSRIIVKIALGFIILLLAIVILFAFIAIDRPPKIADMSALKIQRTAISDSTFEFDKSWLRRSRTGLWEAYLEGDPFERGVAFGQLTKELLYIQESAFFEQIRELIPSDGYLKVLKYFIAFFNRNLDKHITEEYKEEIYGTSFACSLEFDFIGTGYQRQLNYHAAHDIGHALQGLNMVACTSFSVWDGESEDSSLLIGRNFDFYMGEKFAENKIICFVNPSDGYKFMMVTWPDLIGVVSGMNIKGLTVTLNASKSSIPSQAATPVTLLAREILQYASTINEAFEIAKRRKLFVSESLMIGSASDGKTAIIEKSPAITDILYPQSDQIVCSNHFQSKGFANDEKNMENINETDSYNRYRRMQELVNRYKNIDVSDAALILRDQRALGDSDAGMGNQLAINQLIAHHSVIFKPDSLIVWVSTSPWQLGEYVAYDLKKIFDDPGLGLNRGEIHTAARTIPADTFLHSPGYKNFRLYQEMTRQLNGMKRNHDLLPSGFAERYIHTNPQLYSAYVHLGDYYSEMKNYEDAYAYYMLALTRQLPGNDEKVRIKKISEEIIKKQDHGRSRN